MGSITIIGAGLAGLAAATELAKQNIPCCLVSPQPSERAQSVLAEGGINAALDTMGEHDTPAEHFQDTMRGGVYLADPEAVEGLTAHAPEIVRRLASLGAALQYEDGHLMQRNFGGQKKKRTAYAKSSTGKILMTALIDEARKHEQAGTITRMPHHAFVQLLLTEGACAGVRVRDTYTGQISDLAGPVILCSGGMNGMFPEMTTGTTQNTGNVTAVAFAQGASLANLEMIQYHPTTIGICGKRCLISEAARGEGGRLCILRDGALWYFMEELFPELGNLMPRDVVSREMYKAVRREDCEGPVLLDMTALPDSVWRRKLSDLREECIHYLGLDPAKELLPVEPGIHYFMGGLYVDKRHRTSIPGLYAAGECACQYHGANRLGGNSMLGAVYGGRVAAHDAAGCTVPELPHTVQPLPDPAMPPVQAARLRDILLSGLGIVRDRETMQAALDRLGELTHEQPSCRIRLGEAMLRSALLREESRGAHFRTDFPEPREECRRPTVARQDADGHITVSYAGGGADGA